MKIVRKVLIKIKENILGFIVGFTLTASITVAFATGLLSSGVTYDNTDSGLSSTTVQGALDELTELANNSSGGAYVYAFNTSYKYYTGANQSTLNSLGTVYGTMQALATANSENFGLKYKIENNMVTEAYVCVLSSGEEICLKGSTDGSMYAANKAAMESFFTGTNGSCDSCDSSSCRCGGGGLNGYARAASSGGVTVNAGDWTCYVYIDGSAYCKEW